MSTFTKQIVECRRNPPDFTFPPKYNLNSTPSPPVPRIRLKPSFGFLNAVPGSDEKITSHYRTAPQSAVPDTSPPLLRLPYEIRLQIYRRVLEAHPIFHAHLAPSSSHFHQAIAAPTKPVDELHTAFFRPLGQSLPTPSFLTTSTMVPPKHQPVSALSPLSTPMIGCKDGVMRGKIPTGLLASCRQIYGEVHLLPWQQNTFSFINWFWSGVYASRQFTRALRPWQSDALRWVGVEVLSRDLVSSADVRQRDVQHMTEEEVQKGRTEWGELCWLWKGVWGLRLGIKGGVRTHQSTLPDHTDQAVMFFSPEEMSLAVQPEQDKGILDIESNWVTHGLLEMRSLRWIELEIEDEEVEREEKFTFCRELECALNHEKRVRADGCEDPVKVVFVEKMKKVEAVSDKDFKWYGGIAGNGSIAGEL